MSDKSKRTLNNNPSAAVRIRVMKRDKFMCTYCGASGNDTELEIDHIIPVSKGGSNHISNLATSCMACNRKKGAKIIKDGCNQKTSNILIDKPIHTLKDGEIERQAVIIEQQGDCFLIQLFSFLDGRPTNITTISKSDLFDLEKCKIYANEYEWQKAYYEELKAKGLLSGTVEECIEATRLMGEL